MLVWGGMVVPPPPSYASTFVVHLLASSSILCPLFDVLLLLPLFAAMLVYTGQLMHYYPGCMAEFLHARMVQGERLSKAEARLLLWHILLAIDMCHQAGIINQ